MNITVHGEGLTALVTAVSLAATGHHVQLACRDALVRAALEEGDFGFDEPGLGGAFLREAASGRLSLREAGEGCMPTAVHFFAFHQDEEPLALARAATLAPPAGELLLVNQVTFGVGAAERLLAHVRERHPGGRLAVASFPDFLRQGAALANFNRPDRLILGVTEPWAEAMLREILRPFTANDAALYVMPPRDAEFTKLALNGMLATRLSFMNDMANVADVLGVDIENVRLGVGSDPRIGSHYLHAGCGFGGIGFYQDLLSLKKTLDESGVASKLLDTALDVNAEQKELLFRRLWRHFRGDLAGRTVAIWGVAFKPDTDRIDYAPSLRVVEALLAQGAHVRAHDPKALPQLRAWLGGNPALHEVRDAYEAANNADALLVLTEWREYASPDFAALRSRMRTPLLLDGRNLYNPEWVRGQGFTYYGVGRR